MEFDKKPFPIVKVDGFVENGKQFDIDINLPDSNVKKYIIKKIPPALGYF